MKYSEYKENDIELELLKTIQKLGRFPKAKELDTSLFNAIYKSNSSLNSWSKKLGYKLNKKSDGYWENFDVLVNHIQPLVKNGIFPTLTQITQNISGGARAAIGKFGGIECVAKRMGCKLGTFYIASDGHHLRSSLEFMFDEYLSKNGVPHEVDGLISDKHKYRYDFKINDTYVEIWGMDTLQENDERTAKYHEKRKIKEDIYKVLGLELVSIDHDFFNKTYLEIEKNLENLLEKIGIKTREVQNIIETAARICGFWNEIKITDEIKEIIEKTGSFPAQSKMRSVSGLTDAVARFGGINYFRNKMNYPCVRMNYWTDKKIIEELKTIYKELKHTPNTTDLRKLGRIDLISAVCKRKGIEFYRNQLF